MTRTRILTVAVVAALVVAGACSAADDDDSASMTGDGEVATTLAPAEAEAEGDDDAADTSSGATDGAGSGAAGGEQLTEVSDIDLVAAQTDRRIVYRGELTSEVDDVAAAARSARDSVAAEGGFVFGQELTDGMARVVLKVPSVRFDAAFDAVAGIGEVTSQFIEADDVSEQYTDLESRRATLATSIDRIRGFLAEASNVDEISRLESELTRREAEHDVIAGQLRVLEDRTSLATITVTFTAPDGATTLTEEQEEAESGPPGFGRGLEVGWDAVVFAAGTAATAVGFALPFAPVLALAVLGLWWFRRRAARAFA